MSWLFDDLGLFHHGPDPTTHDAYQADGHVESGEDLTGPHDPLLDSGGYPDETPGMFHEHDDFVSALYGDHDPSYLAGQTHWHLTSAHNAVDTNSNGLSDAVENHLGLPPTDQHGSAAHIFGLHGPDSDGDGWPDAIEEHVGTGAFDPTDHPMIVEAHHSPEGSGANGPEALDLPLPPMP